MNPEQRENFRWQFAGRTMSMLVGRGEWDGSDAAAFSVRTADALIAALEATGPKECKHKWYTEYSPGGVPVDDICNKCGVVKE